LALALTSHAVEAAPVGLAPATSLAVLTGTASAAGLPLIAVFQLMTTSKTVLIAASAALLLTVGTATYEGLAWSNARAAANTAEQSAEAAKSERDRVARELAAALESAGSKAASPGPKVSASSVPNAPTQGPVAGNAALAAAAARGRDFMERHPEVRTALLKWSDGETEAKYGPLFKELQLTPAEIGVFKSVYKMLNYAQTLGPDRELYQFESEPVSPEASAKFKKMLGPDGERRLQQYTSDRRARAQAESIAGSMMWVEPLSSAQAQQLVSFVAASETKPFQMDWDQLMLKARPLLSSQQLAIMDGLRKRDAFDRAVQNAGKSP